MKKLALAMVFVLLMALFIAFNYLLWDRQNRESLLKDLENKNADVNASISVQNREIKGLEDENTGLQTQIDQLQKEKLQLQQGNDQVTKDLERVTQERDAKISSLNTLKQLVDEKLLEAPIVKWVSAIDDGKYEDAYKLEYNSLVKQESLPNLADYSDNLKNTIKSIGIESMKLDPDRGSDTGDIYVLAVFNVKLADKADPAESRLPEGTDEVRFKMEYDTVNATFVIKEIT